MAGDRIQPKHTPSTSSGHALRQPSTSSSSSRVSSKSKPPPGTYIIELPKDQVYWYPPPDAHLKFLEYVNNRKSRRSSCCCRCFCWTIAFLALLLVLLALAAALFYLIFRPESPKYSVVNVAIHGFNLTSSPSSSSLISPAFDVTIRSENPNDKIGIYYEKGSAVDLYYSGIHLSHGKLPAFYQPSNNFTLFKTVLKGSRVVLTGAVKSKLKADSNKGSVPLRVNVRAPVKIKAGGIKTWKITVNVNCDVTVNKLTEKSKIISKDCKYGVEL
ncbi:NDR1/HIN1-like protein 13 [Impatiens glandulifera]|uniref:NDR1/HIN1-like protein 13 n=1 Tax=Impatiens glandulifera TaxID=253017 RepID=UPI001FB083FE|nr:NDR1/HIN1-like protein 13 [Impatiens glandulifera]